MKKIIVKRVNFFEAVFKVFMLSIMLFGFTFLIAASSIPGGYYSAPNFFLLFKEFELYWCAVFLQSKNWIVLVLCLFYFCKMFSHFS